jgi:peptide deformylase
MAAELASDAAAADCVVAGHLSGTETRLFLSLLRKSCMALLPILRYPDPRLHKIAGPVTVFDERLKKLVADMAETMYDAPGIGLAATQIDVHQQVIVIDVSETRDQLQVLVNPEILWASDDRQLYEEGCLSVPGIYDGVERPSRVRVRSLDLDGNPREFDADGLFAVCVQHEMDHLKGKVFVEYLSPLKRNRIKTKLQKEERELKRDKQAVAAR